MTLIYDLVALVGIILIGYGVWQWSPAAALVVVGSILLILSVISAFNASRKSVNRP